MNKYEKLIEHIINDNEQAARELFHEIVVEKSRDIYESLMDEEQVEEIGGNQVDSLVDEISADEEGIGENEEEFAADDAELDLGGEEEGEEEFGSDEEIGGEETGSKEEVAQNIEDALEELKAEFEKLMGFDGEEAEGEEEGEESLEQFAEGEECDSDEEEEDEEEEEVEESAKSEADLMREYVEKVAAPSNTEGADNKGSVVAGKNDMGGTVANIAKGGEESGMKAPKAKDIASGNINVPGGKAGSAFSKAKAAKTGEVSGTNTKSIEG